MRPTRFIAPVLVGTLAQLALACGSPPPPPPPPPPPAPAQTTAASVTAPPPEPVKPPEPTPEEKKKAEEQKKLAEDREKAEAAAKAELARFTPELHAEAKALADKSFPDTKTALKAVLAGKHRVPGHAERDAQRHPAETLELFGVKPTSTVLEYSPGEGWYTEILAPLLAKKGKLFVTNTDPNGPADQRSTFYGWRFKSFLDKAPELYGKAEVLLVDKEPGLALEGKADVVLVMRALHGMQNSGKLDAWLAQFHKALKPGGVLGIEQHRAKADANPVESSKQGYLPEKWVIEKVEAAGFKLATKSEINANPKDTKDYANGVWTLPPSLELGEKDRAKYVAIGESDRMTLKFVKVAPKAAPAAAKPAAAKPAAAAPAKPAAPAAPAKPASKK